MAEGARLESVCILTGYRGFESLPLRQDDIKFFYNLRQLEDFRIQLQSLA